MILTLTLTTDDGRVFSTEFPVEVATPHVIAIRDVKPALAQLLNQELEAREGSDDR